MKKMKQRFPIGTLVQARIPRMGEEPFVLLGLVISHVEYELRLRSNETEPRCEVFFGPNPWLPHLHIIPVAMGHLKSISRTYTK